MANADNGDAVDISACDMQNEGLALKVLFFSVPIYLLNPTFGCIMYGFHMLKDCDWLKHT